VPRYSVGGHCCVELDWAAQDLDTVDVRSDRLREFAKHMRDTTMGTRVNAELIVTATNVLHERVTANDHPRGVVAFEAAHRAEPRFEPTVVALDAVVPVLLNVVKRGRHQFVDRRP
jgi:hypothetical protein